jgi:hypothetical protein
MISIPPRPLPSPRSRIYVADTICCQANRGFNLSALRQKLDDAELGALNIDAGLIERTRNNLPQLLEGASALMG